MADVPRMTDDERHQATVAALKRERDQHANRTDDVGKRRVAEIDAQLAEYGEKSDDEPQGRRAPQRRTTSAD